MYKIQVLLHVSDYATIGIYSISAFIVAILALILPIETKGRSLTVSAENESEHKISTGTQKGVVWPLYIDLAVL